MMDPLPSPRRHRRVGPLRRRILRGTSALPALATLMNCIAGLIAIYYASREGLGHATPGRLSVGAWWIVVAMVFDALDGRLARMTRKASDFGAQLDSLCDVVSFGVAPAVLMVQTIFMALQGGAGPAEDPLSPNASAIGRVVLAVGALYVCCAILRLARFNTENAPDVTHHMYFKGLPSPGAAAAVAAAVLLFDYLAGLESGASWRSSLWFYRLVGTALPIITAAVAVLMVTRFRYPHVVNQFVTGKKSFNYLVKALLALLLALVFLQLAVVIVTLGFAAAGPVEEIRLRLRARGKEAPPEPAPPP